MQIAFCSENIFGVNHIISPLAPRNNFERYYTAAVPIMAKIILSKKVSLLQ